MTLYGVSLVYYQITTNSAVKKNFMVPFYGWGSTASRLQSHIEEAVYFLPLSSLKFLVLI